jgi:hypothetical protein
LSATRSSEATSSGHVTEPTIVDDDSDSKLMRTRTEPHVKQVSDSTSNSRGKPPLKLRRPRPDDNQPPPTPTTSQASPEVIQSNAPLPRIRTEDARSSTSMPGGPLLRRLSDYPTNGPPLVSPSLKDRMQPVSERMYRPMEVDREYGGRRSGGRRRARR